MNCPDELELSIYLDGEAAQDDAAAIAAHLGSCSSCRRRFATLEGENAALRAGLGEWQAWASRPATPPMAPAPRIAAALVAAGATTSLTAAGWNAIALEVPDWLNPLSLQGGGNVLINLLGALARPQLQGGLTMIGTNWIEAMAVFSLLLITTTVFRQLPRARSAGLAFLALAFLPLGNPAAAFEFRSGQDIVIRSDETIDETVIATGETVRIEGTVDGDVVAAARQITITGTVTGAVVTAGQTIDVAGDFGGTYIGFGQWVRIGSQIAGNVYSGGQSVSLLPEARVGRDAVLLGDVLTNDGQVGRDLNAAGTKLIVNGRVGRNIDVEAEELELASSAEVVGAIHAKLPTEDRLRIASGATVGGPTEVTGPAPQPAKRSKYARPGFYIWRLIRLAGLFVLGAILLWVAPGLLGRKLGSAGKGFLQAGIGFLILVAAPAAILLAGITLVGLPLATIGAALFVVALLLTKVVVADWLGRTLLRTWGDGDRARALLALLLGLAILMVAGNLPWLGVIVKLAVLLLGLGILFTWIKGLVRPATPVT